MRQSQFWTDASVSYTQKIGYFCLDVQQQTLLTLANVNVENVSQLTLGQYIATQPFLCVKLATTQTADHKQDMYTV